MFISEKISSNLFLKIRKLQLCYFFLEEKNFLPENTDLGTVFDSIFHAESK